MKRGVDCAGGQAWGVWNKDAGVTPQLSQHCSEGVDRVRPWLLQR